MIEAGGHGRITGTVTLDVGYDGAIGDEGYDRMARVGVSMGF